MALFRGTWMLSVVLCCSGMLWAAPPSSRPVSKKVLGARVPAQMCASFHYQLCTKHEECPHKTFCRMQKGCVPTLCGCDTRTGGIGLCSVDCVQGVGICKSLKHRPKEQPCLFFNHVVFHGSSLHFRCNDCQCFNGKLLCVKSQCDAPLKESKTASKPAKEASVTKDLCSSFYYKVCRKHADCLKGYRCQAQKGCVPSTCGCDTTSGKVGFCTMDCVQGVGLCKPLVLRKATSRPR